MKLNAKQSERELLKLRALAEAEQAGDLIRHFLRGGNGGVKTPMETTIMVLAFVSHMLDETQYNALLDQLCLTEMYGRTGQKMVVIDAGRLA